MANVIASMKSWLQKPFTTPLDTTTLFLLTGLVIVSIILWSFILRHMQSAAKEII